MKLPAVFRTSRKCMAFSLIELLTVVSIMGLMVSLTVPALSSLSGSGQMNSTISDLAGVLEQARQYAIAQNTYVWVVLNPSTATPSGNTLTVAVLASKTGIDPSPWSSYGSVPNAQIQMIGKMRTYFQVTFDEAGTVTSSVVPSLPAVTPQVGGANSPANDTATFNINAPGTATPVAFRRAIQFTPNGQAHNATGPIDVIEFSLQPSRGKAAAHDVAVMRINGLTGLTTVYRP